MRLTFSQVYQRSFQVGADNEFLILGNFQQQCIAVEITPNPSPPVYHFYLGWLHAAMDVPAQKPLWLKQYQMLNSRPRVCIFPFDIYRLVFFPKIYYSEVATFNIKVLANTVPLSNEELILLMA